MAYMDPAITAADPIPAGVPARQWARSLADAQPHLCQGCDTERSVSRCYCASCGEVTDSYQLGEPDRFAEIMRYCEDPAYRAQMDVEREQQVAAAMAAIDRGMAPLNARQAARWAAEEATLLSERAKMGEG